MTHFFVRLAFLWSLPSSSKALRALDDDGNNHKSFKSFKSFKSSYMNNIVSKSFKALIWITYFSLSFISQISFSTLFIFLLSGRNGKSLWRLKNLFR